MVRRRFLLLAFAGAAAPAAAQLPPPAGYFDERSPPATPEPAARAPAPDPGAYRLAPGDKVRVTVFNQPDVSLEQGEIDNDGNLAVPLIGGVRALGLTQPELAEEIRRRLDRDFLVNPKVSVALVAYRPFYILGEVERPGSYPFASGLTIRRAIAVAGGYTRRASTDAFIVVRAVGTEQRELELELDDALQPGDTITVRRRWF